MSDTIKLTSNSKEVNKKLNELAERVKNIKPALREIAHTITHYVDENFETEGKNNGEKWQQWSDKYASERIRLKHGDGKILTFDGELRESITDEVNCNSLIVGTNKEYAAIHNFGGSVKKRNGGTFEMPKREFMAWTPKLEQIVADELFVQLKFQDYIDKENARIKFLKGN